MGIPVYYINLDARPDRRVFMERQFAQLGLAAERIAAVSPPDLTHAQRVAYCNPARRWSMTEPQYCCNLSHAKAWQALLASGARRALILEDDAQLSAALPRFLAALAKMDLSLSLIRLETWPDKPQRYRAADIEVVPGIGLCECLERGAGAAGYIISSDASRRLLAEPSFHTVLIDGFLFNPFAPLARSLTVRQTDPGLCIQLGVARAKDPAAKGSLRQGAAEHRAARGRHPHVKLARQFDGWINYDLRRLVRRIFEWRLRGVSTRVINFNDVEDRRVTAQ